MGPITSEAGTIQFRVCVANQATSVWSTLALFATKPPATAACSAAQRTMLEWTTRRQTVRNRVATWMKIGRVVLGCHATARS